MTVGQLLAQDAVPRRCGPLLVGAIRPTPEVQRLLSGGTDRNQSDARTGWPALMVAVAGRVTKGRAVRRTTV